MERYDAIVVGGGPGGSTAATHLVKGGLRVAVLDRARFPRVKLCAGWLSEPIWDALELSPRAYPGALWAWDRCHVHYRGRDTSVPVRGHFIRRYEFDDILLRASGAEIHEHAVKSIVRDGDRWVIDGRYEARALIGAGGTHCPVAHLVDPVRPQRPVGVQELELEAPPDSIAEHRLGRDGEPELYLHDDLGGYAWNVPKGGWLNVGCGTVNARSVREAWRRSRAYFTDRDHLPEEALERLEHADGHAYYLYDPSHLDWCEQDGSYLVGDALGLAQPLTAEGILPAVISGRLAAEAFLSGAPGRYRAELARHPVLLDYALYHRLRTWASRLRERVRGVPTLPWAGSRPGPVAHLLHAVVAAGFARLFAGRPLPGRKVRGLVAS